MLKGNNVMKMELLMQARFRGVDVTVDSEDDVGTRFTVTLARGGRAADVEANRAGDETG